MLNQRLLQLVALFCIFVVAAIGGVFLIHRKVDTTSKEYLYFEVGSVPDAQVVMILGARVYEDGRMSDMLVDRVDTALEVYESNKVEKILVSGDHGRTDYDEVNTIKDYLLDRGVVREDIFLDHAGFDTYDSIYRAKEIFRVESLVVSTQEFHLPRAVYIGNALGMTTYGIVADRRDYLLVSRNYQREYIARIKAWFDVALVSSPKYLGERIPITGDSQLSWD